MDLWKPHLSPGNLWKRPGLFSKRFSTLISDREKIHNIFSKSLDGPLYISWCHSYQCFLIVSRDGWRPRTLKIALNFIQITNDDWLSVDSFLDQIFLTSPFCHPYLQSKISRIGSIWWIKTSFCSSLRQRAMSARKLCYMSRSCRPKIGITPVS